MHRQILIVVGLLSVWGLIGCKESSEREVKFGCDVFWGSWVVDYERTMEAVKQNLDDLPGHIKKMTEIQSKGFLDQVYRWEITTDEIVFSEVGKKVAMSYSILTEDAEAKTATIVAKERDREASFTLRLIDGAYMNLRSSKSSDMHYVIWKRAEESAI